MATMTKRLLLLEDETALARAVARLLRRAGFEVFLASTCEEARRAPGTFSLAIFDIQLPDGDGVALAEELLERGAVRRIVFFSGTLSGLDRRRAQRLGPFVEKSMGFAALHATIELSLAGLQVKVAGTEEILDAGSNPPPSGVRGNGDPNDLN